MRKTLLCLIWSGILSASAILALTSDKPIVFVSQDGRQYSSSALTLGVAIAAWAALCCGLIILLAAARVYFAPLSRTDVDPSDASFWQWLGNRRCVRPVVNASLVAISVWTGYGDVRFGPLSLKSKLTICLAAAVAAALFSLAAFCVSTRQDLRPSVWFRFPLDGEGGPLQAFRITIWCAGGLVVGSVAKALSAGMIPGWVSIAYASAFVGLIIGQAFAYRVRAGKRGSGERSY